MENNNKHWKLVIKIRKPPQFSTLKKVLLNNAHNIIPLIMFGSFAIIFSENVITFCIGGLGGVCAILWRTTLKQKELEENK